MAKHGPIMIVEDDADDQEIIGEMLKELGVTNQLIFFRNAHDAYLHMKTTNEQPFLIFSDINMPGETGIEFKRRIDEDKDLRARSIPFVFFSTAVRKEDVDEAYKKMTVQGYFQKSKSYGEQKSLLKMILDYWTFCHHPNS
jgi:CheY-like chemotaxis protein